VPERMMKRVIQAYGIWPADVVARQHRLTSPALGLFEPILACAMLYSQEFKKY
jgi:hypothetical protein